MFDQTLCHVLQNTSSWAEEIKDKKICGLKMFLPLHLLLQKKAGQKAKNVCWINFEKKKQLTKYLI